MYAQQWALCCLITVGSSLVFADDAGVTVVLQHPDRLSSAMLGEMKSELGSLMETAGYQIHWRDLQNSTSAADGDVVVVELRGSCAPPPRPDVQPSVVQLGSSAVADGKVLPFTWVDCTQLARMLESHLTRAQQEKRDFVYGRAIARVAAHEMHHVLERTLDHTETGISKARFALDDLLDERVVSGHVAAAFAPSRLMAVP